MSFVRSFEALLSSGRRTGYAALVRPASFEEQVEEHRLVRDLEDGGGPAPCEPMTLEEILRERGWGICDRLLPEDPPPVARRRRPRRCTACGEVGHYRPTCGNR